MKKASIILSTIALIFGILGTTTGAVFTIVYSINLAGEIMKASVGDEAVNLGFYIVGLIGFILLMVYFTFATVTGYLTRRVVEDNILDKIGKFGILSIIFFNVPGGIVTLVYDKQLKKYLEKTAPKGKRKEATKK